MGSYIGEEQAPCSVLGVASPACRFTGLVCLLGVILFYFRVKLSTLGTLLHGAGAVI